MLICDTIQKIAKQYPAQTALSYKTDILSYESFISKANQIAHYLKNKGAKPDDIIGVYCERSFDLMLSITGILLSGAAYLPLDPTFPQSRIQHILKDATPKWIITQQHLQNSLHEQPSNILLFDELSQISAELPTSPVKHGLTPNNLAYVIYTSGSTGKPKGVLIEHKGLPNLLLQMQITFNITPYKRILQLANICFDVSVAEWLSALGSGAQLCLLKEDELPPYQAISDTINQKNINILYSTPSLLSSIGEDLMPTLETIVSAGEALPQKLIEQYADKFQLINAYGPTEATVYATFEHCKADETISIGHALENVSVYILNEQSQHCEINITGEICLSGEGLARGYLNQPELTAEKFTTLVLNNKRTTIYRTGDYGLKLANGKIKYLGRHDNQVKIRGHRIELDDIITIIERHAGIKKAVIKVVGNIQSRRLALYYLPNQHQPIELDDLHEHLKNNLPKYMWPTHLIEIEDIPVTTSGKIDYHRLPAHSTGAKLKVLPRTITGKKIARVWCDILTLSDNEISLYDDFFQLGGTSILFTSMIASVQKALSKKIDINALLEKPTIKQLQYLIDTDKAPFDFRGTQQLIRDDLTNFKKYIRHIIIKKPTDIPMHHVFLTGATGFLGAYLLSELCQKGMQVYCLIRAQNKQTALKRLTDNLKKYGHSIEHIQSQVHIILGDLSELNCGINEKDYSTLCEKIDTVFHNGAKVNHFLNYRQMRQENVQSTAELIKFCCSSKLKQLNFISSVSAITQTNAQGEGVEAFETELPDAFSDGYGASKWVAEQFIYLAIQQGLPARIYRPGNIFGDSQTGVMPANDNHILLMLKACIKMQVAPINKHGKIEMTPVDILAKKIIDLSCKRETIGQIYNLNNSHYLSWQEFVTAFQSLGYQLEFSDDELWNKAAQKYYKPTDSVFPLLILHKERHILSLQQWETSQSMRVKNYLPLIKKCHEWLVYSDFLPAPS